MRLSDSGLFAIVLMLVTVVLAYMRPKIATENNWPLLYFIALVLYQKVNEDVLGQYPVFIGIVCAGMIRFEFMNLRFVKLFRWIELMMLLYVIWQLFKYVMYF
jgi:hypothetical protein